MRLQLADVRRYAPVHGGLTLIALAVLGAPALAAEAAASAAAASTAAAETTAGVAMPLDASLFKTLQWRCIGPFRGGRALTGSGIPGNASTFYFGAVAGGVWKTTDGGETWSSLTDGTPISSVGALALAPSNPDVIYVGTGEAAPRGDIT